MLLWQRFVNRLHYSAILLKFAHACLRDGSAVTSAHAFAVFFRFSCCVKICLGKDELELSAAGIRSKLKARKQKLAKGTTTKLSETEGQFEEFMGSLDTDKICMKLMQYTPYFAYVALLMSFFDKMVQMNPESIYICSDFTFKVEVMNYSSTASYVPRCART